MQHPAYLAAIALLAGSATGGVALGQYATGDWRFQQAAILEAHIFEEETYSAPVMEPPTIFAAAGTGPHVCQGCDARLPRAYGPDPDAYAQDEGRYAPPIAPDAYAVDPDWGGGRPPREEAAASYHVLEDSPMVASEAAETARDKPALATAAMANATPLRLPPVMSVAAVAATD